jgi:hypothetical protein
MRPSEPITPAQWNFQISEVVIVCTFLDSWLKAVVGTPLKENGRFITGVTILVAPVESRKRGHRHLGAAADKSTTERVSRQCEA